MEPFKGCQCTYPYYGCLSPVSYRPKRGAFMGYPSGSGPDLGPRDLGITSPPDLTSPRMVVVVSSSASYVLSWCNV